MIPLNPSNFLLQQIVGYETNGLSSLGQLDAKHFTDITKIMIKFSELSISSAVTALNNGESIGLSDGTVLCLKTTHKRKSKHFKY